MDKEKVIAALERCIGCQPCKDCPFDATLSGITNFPGCMVSLQKEALKLIHSLTEQTVFKEALYDGMSYKEELYDTVFICSKCGCRTIGRESFCSNCGRPVGAVLSTEKIKKAEVIRRDND